MPKFPFKHANLRPHNWLIYVNHFRFLQKFNHYYHGHLYDLGCGEMPYKNWLLNYAEQYTGVDWGGSPHGLKADILADLNESLPIASEVADTVISLSVMEHLHAPQVFLGEAHRILKPGGAMIMQVPFMWWVHEAPFDYYRYTRYGLQYMFEKAGFTDVTVYPQTGFWVMWTLKFNYQTTRLVRGPWPMRKALGLLMRMTWAIDQHVAPWLDHYWPCEGETAGYFVTASKSHRLYSQ